MRWVCEVMQRTHVRANRSDRCVPIEEVTGETADISEYLDFGFYDRVWYHANAGLGERLHGRWLGVAHRIFSLMSYWILTQTGSVIARTAVQQVTSLEYQVDENKDIFREFDLEIKKRLNEQDLPLEGYKTSPSDWAELMDHDEDFAE